MRRMEQAQCRRVSGVSVSAPSTAARASEHTLECVVQVRPPSTPRCIGHRTGTFAVGSSPNRARDPVRDDLDQPNRRLLRVADLDHVEVVLRAARRRLGHLAVVGRDAKRLLVLEERPTARLRCPTLRALISSTTGLTSQRAVRKVRNWLVSEAAIEAPGAARVLARYVGFQGWYYQKQLAAGFSEDDIKDYPTSELLKAMLDWMQVGQPLTPD